MVNKKRGRSPEYCERCGARMKAELVERGATTHDTDCQPSRRLESGARTTKKAVTLDDETVKYLLGLGGGNLSEGVREAARLAREARKSSYP